MPLHWPPGPETETAVSYHIRPFSEPQTENRDADKVRLHHTLVALGIFKPEDVVSDAYYEGLGNTATRGKLNERLARMVPPFTPDDDTFVAELEYARRTPLFGPILGSRQKITHLQNLLRILGRLEPGSYAPGRYDDATEKAVTDINRHRRGSKDTYALGIPDEPFCHALNALVALLEEAPAVPQAEPDRPLQPTSLAHEVVAKKTGLTPADAYQLHCCIAHMQPGERLWFDASFTGVSSPLPGTIAPYDPVQVTGYSAAALNALYKDVRRVLLGRSKRFVLIKENNGRLRVEPYVPSSPVPARGSFASKVGRFAGIVSLASVLGTAMGLALSGPKAREAFYEDPIGVLRSTFRYWLQGSALSETTETVADPISRSHRVDQMELPEDISDMGAILYAAQPSWDARTGISYDSLISRYAVSRHLFEGKLLLTEVMTNELGERFYAFTIPDALTGETLDFGEGNDTMDHVTWPDVLRLATQAHQVSDDELAGYIVSWYKTVYIGEDSGPIELNPDFFHFDRDAHGFVTQVRYDGPEADQVILLNRRIPNPTIASSGAQPAFSLQRIPKKLTDPEKDHRLLLYTGVDQPFLVPESFLVQDRAITLDLGNGAGRFEFTARELALDIREWFERRDDRTTFQYRSVNNVVVTDQNHERFVIYDTPAIQRLVAQTLEGARSTRERRERLRRLGQSAPYQWEAAVTDVNRPPLVTLLQSYHEDSGGDCNNRSMLLAAVLKAGGFRVALVHAENTPKRQETLRREGSPNLIGGHMFVAVHEDAFEDLSEATLLNMDRVNFLDRPDEHWIGVETGGNKPYGDVPLLEEMDAVWLREVQ